MSNLLTFLVLVVIITIIDSIISKVKGESSNIFAFMCSSWSKFTTMLKRRTLTSVKIENAIVYLRQKKDKLRDDNKIVNINTSKLERITNKQLDLMIGEELITKKEFLHENKSVDVGQTYIIIKRTGCDDLDTDNEIITLKLKDSEVEINVQYTEVIKYFVVPQKSVNFSRSVNLYGMLNRYKNKSIAVENLIIKIKDTIEQRKNDKLYIETMEELNDIGKIDDFDIDMDSINDEIKAVEKQLVFDEKIGEI